MTRLFCRSLVTAGLLTNWLSFGCSTWAADETPKGNPEIEARSLIAKLGNDDFSVREQASAELARLGSVAKLALEDGAKHADREVRYRSQRILTQIVQHDFEQRLEAFLKDSTDSEQLRLPGWERFRKRLGSTQEIKLLFVQMHRTEGAMLKGLQTGGKVAAESLGARCTALQQTIQLFPQELAIGSIASVLFVAGEADVDVPIQTSQIVYSFCYQQTFRNAITTGGNKDLFRKMLGAWILRGNDFMAYQGLMMAMQYDLPEGLVAAEKSIKSPQGQGHTRLYAILALVRFGNETHKSVLLPLLEDKTVCTTWQMNKITIQTQVRDAALAGLLHLNKKNPKDFGFEHIQPTPQYIYNPSSLGFENDTKRDVSIAKWKEFQAEQAKKAG